MLKSDELERSDSCLNRAASDEWIFVIRGHDVAAQAAIAAWVKERLRLKKNDYGDPQLIEAAECSRKMKEQRIRLAARDQQHKDVLASGA